jgi:hypothetical protein
MAQAQRRDNTLGADSTAGGRKADMSRLTARTETGHAYLVNVKLDEQEVDSPHKNTLQCILDCFDRLAAYEDTGLDPEEVAEMARAKADGRCVVLPCKVGDTVYIRRYSLAQKQNIIIEARVAAVKVFRTGFQIDAVTHGGAVNKCEWGRQCFATRAEAEEALKEAQHERD